MSPRGGILRTGPWGDPDNVNPPRDWDIYLEIIASVHGASHHAAVWVEVAD